MQNLYCIGGDVVDPLVLERIQKYSNLIYTAFGIDSVVEKKRRVMLFPPFPSDESTALLISCACAATATLHHHPFRATSFSVKEVCVTEFVDASVIHFPVRVHETAKNQNFADFTHVMQVKLQSYGITWRESIPRECIPHIAILVTDNLIKRKALAKIVERSRTEKPLIFNLDTPKLYMKSKSGWGILWDNKGTVEK